MRNPSLVGALVAAIAVAGLIAACDSEPKPGVRPSPNVQPAQPVVVSVEISGPASIPPGQSAQFTAISRLSDGTSQTATTVRWSSHTGLLRVDASGLATARQQTGDDILSAEVTSSGPGGVIRGSREILVLPEGTYRMVGVVTENGPPPTPIVGARVEVTSGPPVVAVTDWDGRYRLYGVPGTADIRVTRDGYQPHVQSFQLAEHVTQNFQLALSGMRLDLAGPYTLAIEVACSTSTPVAADLRHRSYAAFLTQRGSTLEVVLTESSRFRVNSAGRGDRFSGRVDAAGATFNLRGPSWYYFPYDPSTDYPNVVERLSSGTFLTLDGTALTRGSPAGLSGDLRGGVSHWSSTFPTAFALFSPGCCFGTCYSPAHRFTLTPR